ncbi:hypothetical protein [Streptomyces sp. URMC 123]|uniref:hypothetical protein n=1 Tax=Streptomyces sp. URMC 123 TaxID=3423403 RepID=UPI003F1C5F60
MPDIAVMPVALAASVESAASQGGPGAVLRTVLVVSVAGAVLLAWFLLRGYGSGSASGEDGDGGGRSGADGE